MKIETRVLLNKVKIVRVMTLLKVGKSKGKVGYLQNLLFQAMINIIVYSLMLNSIIPSLYEESNIKRLILLYSIVLIFISYYSIIMFESKKDLQKQFLYALFISGNTYLLSYLTGGLNIF